MKQEVFNLIMASLTIVTLATLFLAWLIYKIGQKQKRKKRAEEEIKEVNDCMYERLDQLDSSVENLSYIQEKIKRKQEKHSREFKKQIMQK